MSAYLIVDLEIVDPVGFEEYKKRVVPIVENYDDKYIVAGGLLEPETHCHDRIPIDAAR